ncbi:uncharacterized protein LOC114756151 [Neltuma alba]|uniref:uncharacterized protein LOC114756151 n=1 Tax=Neltuma alba TaxID=207710 RepID=UPI0010A411A7|nr:uncharacterized protein LOC114756151 [Prosopis alba]
MFEGPWLYHGHYIAVQRWSPNFNPYCNKVRKVAIWVRVPMLPMHCYSEECMWELGNLIGKALKVDMNTLAQSINNGNHTVERGKFARVSVEVDLNKKLQARFVLRRTIYTVEYEGLDAICFKCGVYGHKQDHCSLNTEKREETPEQSAMPMDGDHHDSHRKGKHTLFSVPGVTPDEPYGDWMKATKIFKRRPSKTEGEKQTQGKASAGSRPMARDQKATPGTRFDVLQDMDNLVKSAESEAGSKNKETVKEWRRKESTADTQKRNATAREKKKVREERSSVGGHKMAEKKMQEAVTSNVKRGKETEEGNIERARVGQEVRKEGREDLGFVSGPFADGPSSGCSEKNKKRVESKKRNQATRPKITSPILKRKAATRIHQVIAGSLLKSGPLNFNQETVRSSNSQAPMEAKMIHGDLRNPPEKPPDIATTSIHEEQGKDATDVNDYWYETQDEVKEVEELEEKVANGGPML